MYRALITKELREIWWVSAAACLLLLYYVSNDVGLMFFESWPPIEWRRPTQYLPFIGGDLVNQMGLVVGTLGLALGFWQTVSEDLRGTWPFWLHRPVPRVRMIGIKLVIGLALVTAAGTIPILCEALWFSRPGTRAAPFYWWQTGEAWQYAIIGPLLYLGAFYCGLRDARWYGTRLLPLGAVALWLLVDLQFLGETFPAIGMGMTMLFAALFVAAIIGVVQGRDFS